MFSFLRSEKNQTDGKPLRLWLLLPLLGLGVLLLVWGNGSSNSVAEATTTPYVVEEDELILYQTYLEGRIRALCSSVAGVGEVTAVVTLEGGFTSHYATEQKSNGQEYVILGSGTGATALFLSRTAPGIAGIGIVCHGGASPEVRGELIALLSAAFDVPSNHIYVTLAGS
ncbi:MAG: hypothetical protein IJX28_04925 [Clostridia bacterium]|nr:hypothetical protein [Clostridia bacterium]